MAEERAQILEMLVAGRVTVDQAERLLQAIEAPSSPPPHGQLERHRGGPHNGEGTDARRIASPA